MSVYTNAQNLPPNLKAPYPFKYRELEEFSRTMNVNDSLKPTYIDGSFVYIYLNKPKQINKSHYEEAYPYQKNHAVVKQNGKYGIIDRQGKFVITPIYTDFYIPDDQYGVVFQDGSSFSFSSGKQEANIFSEVDRWYPQTYAYKVGEKFGIRVKGNVNNVRIKGEINIKPIYDSVLYTSYKYIIVKYNGKYGIIDTAGNTILPFQYTDFANSSYDYLYYFALKKDSYWYYYFNLNQLFKSKYEPIELRKDKHLFKIQKLYNFFNDSGKVMLSQNYKYISGRGCLAVDKKNKIVFLDHQGKPFVYYSFSQSK